MGTSVWTIAPNPRSTWVPQANLPKPSFLVEWHASLALCLATRDPKEYMRSQSQSSAMHACLGLALPLAQGPKHSPQALLTNLRPSFPLSMWTILGPFWQPQLQNPQTPALMEESEAHWWLQLECNSYKFSQHPKFCLCWDTFKNIFIIFINSMINTTYFTKSYSNINESLWHFAISHT